MGAHVWAPQYLKDHLLSHGRVTGWTPDWYAGFPALTFYFPLPALIVALSSFIIPYDIAFKLVTVSGLVTLPIAVYVFGRCARLPFPAPACMAALTLPFLFDTGYTILGGNIASTLAGEFSFSIGLSFAFVFLGLIAGGLDTGRRRALAAVFAGLVVLSHILPTIFALVGGMLLMIMRLVVGVPRDVPVARYPSSGPVARSPVTIFGRYAVGVMIIALSIAASWFFLGMRSITGVGAIALQLVFICVAAMGVAAIVGAARGTVAAEPRSGRSGVWRWAIPVGLFGGCLSGFWALPFVVRSPYMNDMGWEKIGTGEESGMKLYDSTIVDYSDALFPGQLTWLMVAAFAGMVVSLLMRRRIGTFFTLMAFIWAAGFVLMPQGRLWNARLLPFWYLSLYLLVGLLIAEVSISLLQWWRERTEAGEHAAERERDPLGTLVTQITPITTAFVAVLVALVVVVPKLPPPSWWPGDGAAAPWHDPSKSGSSFIPGWAEWNYSGYDGQRNGAYVKPAYTEYKTLVETMHEVGKTNGCGRAMWEYEPTLDRFGTPMALMLMPTWTNGCIGSMEGLFFESSATVPYHFLNQALLSQTPSSAMRNLPYGSLDIADGVTKLQILGVKYYMAVSPEAQAQAAAEPRLHLVSSAPAAAASDGSTRSWNIYEVADSDIVAPLQNLPVVMTSPDTVTPIVNKEAEVGKMSAREAWLENAVAWYQDPALHDVPFASSGPSSWPRVENVNSTPERVPTEPVDVTSIAVGDDRISFKVNRTGVPVIVKASYFPNWQAQGADGPYRITPNLMVVVPTDNDVSLHYGHTPIDWLGMTSTVVGATGVVWLWRRDRELVDVAPADVEPVSGPPRQTDEQPSEL